MPCYKLPFSFPLNTSSLLTKENFYLFFYLANSGDRLVLNWCEKKCAHTKKVMTENTFEPRNEKWKTWYLASWLAAQSQNYCKRSVERFHRRKQIAKLQVKWMICNVKSDFYMIWANVYPCFESNAFRIVYLCVASIAFSNRIRERWMVEHQRWWKSDGFVGIRKGWLIIG